MIITLVFLWKVFSDGLCTFYKLAHHYNDHNHLEYNVVCCNSVNLTIYKLSLYNQMCVILIAMVTHTSLMHCFSPRPAHCYYY